MKKKIKSLVAGTLVSLVLASQAATTYYSVEALKSWTMPVAWAAELADISLTFANHTFTININSSEKIAYLLAYQTPQQTEVLQGAGQDAGGFRAEVVAGTCSGADCTYHEVKHGVLKIKDEKNVVNVLYFTIENGTLVKGATDSSFELSLTDDEQTWLLNPTAQVVSQPVVKSAALTQSIQKQAAIEPTIVANPVLADTCGLDLALVLDSSGSIDNKELNKMRAAFISFADAFLPHTATQIAVIDFDDTARLVQDFTNDKTLVTKAINKGTSGGWTNWQSALQTVDALTFPRSTKPDLVIFASDGHPTRPKPESQEKENMKLAIEAANQLKSQNIRIMTLGIGNDLDPKNLQQISGPKQDTGDINTDVITTNFDTLAKDLAAFSNQLCAGKISVQKQIDRNADGDVTDLIDMDGSFEDELLANWQMSISGSATQQLMTDAAGAAEFKLDPGTYSLSELLAGDSEYTLQQAHCYSNNDPMGSSTEVGVNGIILDRESIVTCTIINEPKQKPVSESVLHLEKVNDKPNPVYANSDVTYTLTITAPFQDIIDVVITDVLPEGFTYIPGSWTAVSNLRGDLRQQELMEEAVYHSPGDWFVGTLLQNEVVTITLAAHIDSTVLPGTYVDRSAAVGSSRGQEVRANEDPFYVETQVAVVADPPTETGIGTQTGGGSTSGSTQQTSSNGSNTSSTSTSSNQGTSSSSSAQNSAVAASSPTTALLPKTGSSTELLASFVALIMFGVSLVASTTYLEQKKK